MSFASLRRIIRNAKKGLCSSCAKAKYPQLEAAGIGHVGCLMYTVDTGGLNVRDEYNASALHMAARKGQIQVLIYLIQNKIATEVYRAANGATPAHDAAGTGNLDCLRYLIIHSSCSPHDRDLNGSTPLHWGTQFGHLQVVAWLVLETNAQIDATTKTGVTPLHLAASKGHTNILRWMINHAYKKHANPMRLVNSRARNGATPIYFAAQEGHIEIVKWLAEKAGGDPTIFSNAGMAPLHAAAQEGHIECVQYLFRFGLATSADGGLRTRQDGASALHYAACQGHEGVVAWLLSQKQCTGSEKDFTGSTPVHDAADEGRVRILQVFYNHGVNLAVENAQGDTALDLARRRGMNACAQFLEKALKRKLPRSPAKKQEVVNREDDKLLITEVADFYGSSPRNSDGPKWETFRDLMESEDLLDDVDKQPHSGTNDVEEEKRKKLREQMRREEDMKKRMRMEKMKDQKAKEEQIRENLLAEEESILNSLKESGYHSLPTQRDNRRPVSMPALLPSTVGRDKDEKQKPTEVNDTKKSNGKKMSNRYLRKSTISDTHLLSSNSSSSSLEKAVNGVSKPVKANTSSTMATTMDSSRIPSPPPVPKMEYLLSKLPKSKQIQIHNLIKAESLLSNSSDGNDSDTGSVESGHSRSSGGSSGKRKKREGTDSSPAQRRQNKLGSSPPLPRRARVRQLTPYVKADGMKKHPLPSPKRLFYDEALPLGQISPRHSSPSPTVSPFSSGASSRNITPSSSFRNEATQSHNDSSSPYDFMKALNTAVKKAPNKLKIMRQNAIDHDEDSDGSVSPTLLEIEHQIEAMQQMVDGDTHVNRQQFQSSAKDQDDDEDDDDESSDTETSSEDDMDEFVQLNMIKPHMQAGGANVHMPKRRLSPAVLSGGLGGGVINRGRLVQKRQVYRPRLFSRRRFIRLDTILEETEEKIYSGTPHERAIAFWTLRLQGKVLKKWLSHVEFMKVAYNHAENMYQKARRDLITRVFYSWVQVRNYGALEKINNEKAEHHNCTATMSKAFAAWRYAMELVQNKPLETVKDLKSSLSARSTTQPASLSKSSRSYSGLVENKPQEMSRQLKSLSPSQPNVQAASLSKTAQSRFTLVERKSQETMKQITSSQPSQPTIQHTSLSKASRSQSALEETKPVKPVETKPVKPVETKPTSSLSKSLKTQSTPSLKPATIPLLSTSRGESKASKTEEYLEWLNKYLKPLGEHADNLGESVASGVYVLRALGEASGTKIPRYHERPILPLQRMSNWKLVTDFMKQLGINVRGIEPEDLTNNNVACLHNMFSNILKWEAKRL